MFESRSNLTSDKGAAKKSGWGDEACMWLVQALLCVAATLLEGKYRYYGNISTVIFPLPFDGCTDRAYAAEY